MRRFIGLLLLTLSTTVLLGSTVPAGRAISQPSPDEPQPVSGGAIFAPGEIVVKVKDGAPADTIASLNRNHNARVEEKMPNSRVNLVDLPDDLTVAEAVRAYESSPGVAYAEPNYKLYAAGTVACSQSDPLLPSDPHPCIPDDPSFSKMYDMNNRGQYGGTYDADLDAPEAWKVETGSPGTIVAVIDTGVDIHHPDLNDNIWTNPGETGLDAAGNDKATNGVDDDNNGYVDDVHGWDFYNDDASVFDPKQKDAHGTHVAGTIAAEGDNDRGVTGVSWQARIMPLKFIGPYNDGTIFDAAEALDYAVRMGAKISNNSYGGWYDSCGGCYAQTLQDAIARADRADHLYVAAAMNGGSDFVGDDTDANPIYPSSYNNPNILTVAATNNDDELTSFSNYGLRTVDLAAPGKDILSTWPGNRYAYGLGTSMATPHVTGVAALIKSKYPQLTDTQIKDRILANVDKKPGLQGKLVSGGRLNAAKALGADTAPVIDGVSPHGRASVTPTITATVHDDETDLSQSQIQLYIDGNQKLDFSYDQATDTLTYVSGKLANRRHKIQVVADDGQGLQEARTWTFWAGRRR